MIIQFKFDKNDLFNEKHKISHVVPLSSHCQLDLSSCKLVKFHSTWLGTTLPQIFKQHSLEMD